MKKKVDNKGFVIPENHSVHLNVLFGRFIFTNDTDGEIKIWRKDFKNSQHFIIKKVK